jgi:hypothetical protein
MCSTLSTKYEPIKEKEREREREREREGDFMDNFNGVEAKTKKTRVYFPRQAGRQAGKQAGRQ